MMKKFWVLLLVLALVCPMGAQAESPVTGKTEQKRMEALLDKAAKTQDEGRRVELVLEAAEHADENADALLTCAFALMEADANLTHADALMDMLQRAVDCGQGSTRMYALGILGDVLFALGRGEEAISMLQQAASEAPDNMDLATMLATALQQAGEVDAAQAVLEDFSERTSETMEIFIMRAMLYQQAFRWQEALDIYRQVEEKWPASPSGLFGQYEIYKAMGEFERAARTLDKLLSMGADASLWMMRAELCLWQMHDPQRALAEVEPILRAAPEDADALYLKAAALAQTGEMEEACALAEDNAVYGPLLSIALLLDNGDWAEAEAMCDELAGDEAFGGHALLYKALVRMSGYDDLQGAEKALAESLPLVGESSQTYQFLGDLRRAQGDRLEAARAYAMADLYATEDPSPLYGLVTVCGEAGRAEDMFTILQDMETRYPGWYETMVARMMAESLVGNDERAFEAFEALRAKFPYAAQSMGMLEAGLLADMGDASARGVAEAWMAENEAELTASDWDSYAYVLLHAGDLDAAQKALEMAETLVSADADQASEARRETRNLRVTRALLCLMQDDMEGCLQSLAEAAELGYPMRQLTLDDAFAAAFETEAGGKLIENEGDAAALWDLTLAPAMPEVEK